MAFLLAVPFDANGSLTDSGNTLTRLDAFPYGSSENQDNQNDQLKGEWLYSDQENVLEFDGVDRYTWTTPEGVETGTYTFDGDYVNFYSDEEGSLTAGYNEKGQICVEGDAGCYYYRSEEF